MRIKKFSRISNVGRFRNVRISGGEYGQLTLIYGLNGRGKTTISAIFRSLKANDPAPILQRRTLGINGDTEVNILSDAGVFNFTGGKWNQFSDQFHVFDESFVIDNVHGGQTVETDHRRNSYRAIVGPIGVNLAKKIDELDEKITQIQATISYEKKVLDQHVPLSLSFEDFLCLPIELELENAIEVVESSIKAVDADESIRKTRELFEIPVFSIPESLELALART